jgi:D-amino-acid dehydrogenase
MRLAVIGGGLIGVATALALARRNHSVVLFERLPQLAGEASHANGGLLTPSQGDPWNAPGILGVLLRSLGREDAAVLLRLRAVPRLARWGLRFLRNARPATYHATTEAQTRLAVYSHRRLAALTAEFGLAYDLSTVGTLKVYRDPAALEHAAALAKMVEPLGVPCRRLAPSQLTEVEPALTYAAGGLVGGLHFPEDRAGDARLFTLALAQSATQAGVEIRAGTAVTGFERSNGRVAAVLTAAGREAVEGAVLCGGVGSPALARKLGFRLPIAPVKGYSITFDVPSSRWGQAGLPTQPVVDDGRHIAVTPLGRRLRFVGTAEFTGEDRSINLARIANLVRTAEGLYPQLKEALQGQEGVPWACLRPMTPDCLPVLGASPVANLWINAGHGYLGWTTGAGAAEAVADLVSGERPALDLAPYGLGRFG